MSSNTTNDQKSVLILMFQFSKDNKAEFDVFYIKNKKFLDVTQLLVSVACQDKVSCGGENGQNMKLH